MLRPIQKDSMKLIEEIKESGERARQIDNESHEANMATLSVRFFTKMIKKAQDSAQASL